MIYAIKTDKGAKIIEGQADKEYLDSINAVYPVLAEFKNIPEEYLEIITVNDCQYCVRKSEDQIIWMQVPDKYKRLAREGEISYEYQNGYIEMYEDEKVWLDTPDKYKKVTEEEEVPWYQEGKTYMSTDERSLVNEIEIEANKKRIQDSKSLQLKSAENNYILLCEQLVGQKIKLGFDQLNTIINELMVTDPQTATIITIKLLAIDAEAKREGGLKWWDDCTWHSDIVE